MDGLLAAGAGRSFRDAPQAVPLARDRFFVRQIELGIRRPREDDAHLARCEGARLVRADDRGRSERFDRRQMPDERVPPRHPPESDRQCNRDDGGERFGDGGDRERDAGFDDQADRCAVQRLEAADHGRDAQRQPCQALAEHVEAALERRRLGPDARDERPDPPEFGEGARLRDDSAGRSGL